MRAKRNDVEEESAADREIAVLRVTFAWVLVLVVLFGVTSAPPSTERPSVQVSIRGSLGGGDTSTQSEGESEEATEIVRASLAMPQVFDVACRMMGEAWADPKPYEMTATFAEGGGKARLTMRMVFVSAESRDEYAQESGGWRVGRLQ
jgi:hypothetical protein